MAEIQARIVDAIPGLEATDSDVKRRLAAQFVLALDSELDARNVAPLEGAEYEFFSFYTGDTPLELSAKRFVRLGGSLLVQKAMFVFGTLSENGNSDFFLLPTDLDDTSRQTRAHPVALGACDVNMLGGAAKSRFGVVN